MEFYRVPANDLLIDTCDYSADLVEQMAAAIIAAGQPVMPIVVIKGAVNPQTLTPFYRVVANQISAVAAQRAAQLEPRRHELVGAWLVTADQLPAVAQQFRVLFN